MLDMMLRKKREAADIENQVSPQIDTLLLVDRSVDLLTPLFTQLTYEGLIDELYGIHNSKLLIHWRLRVTSIYYRSYFQGWKLTFISPFTPKFKWYILPTF